MNHFSIGYYFEHVFNPFHNTGLFLCTLKTSENQRFLDIFRGYKTDQYDENKNEKTCTKLALCSLTLSRRKSLSYRNQLIDLLCESMDWFLYDRDLRHEKVKRLFIMNASTSTYSFRLAKN